MRSLLPEFTDDVDLHAVYAAGWLDEGGVRVNFVSAADGAAQAGGLSEGLQTPGDNAVFAGLRDLADVVLVGSGTATAEGYGAIRPSGARLAARRQYGLADTLPVAVTSRSLRLDPSSALFTEADVPTLVLTCAAAPADKRTALAEVADVVICGEEAVEPVLALAALRERGHQRVLSEGGPTEFGRLVSAGVADELCLSLSPLLGGPDAGRIVAGAEPWPAPAHLRLRHVLEEDGALFLRYRIVD